MIHHFDYPGASSAYPSLAHPTEMYRQRRNSSYIPTSGPWDIIPPTSSTLYIYWLSLPPLLLFDFLIMAKKEGALKIPAITWSNTLTWKLIADFRVVEENFVAFNKLNQDSEDKRGDL